MQVEHGLLGVWTAGIQHVHPVRAKGGPHGLREPLDKEHCVVQGFRINIKEIGGVCEGSDQAMSRCQEAVPRQQSDRPVRPVYDHGRRPSCDDLTEDADHVEDDDTWVRPPRGPIPAAGSVTHDVVTS